VRRIERSHFLISLLVLYVFLLIWSAIGPLDYRLWFLEAAPAIIGIGLCVLFYSRQAFTSTTYFWCFIGACLMTIGAHYSYSEVPLFDLIKVKFNSDRNNYDKIGHFVQGVVVVLISMEIIIRKQIIRNPGWINFFSFCVAMTVAAIYEMIEWLSVVLGPELTDNFLGMQGYIWDAQSDMFLALLGALSVLLFSKRMRRTIESDRS